MKFIVSHSYHISMDYVRKKNFRINDFKIITRACDLRGYDPEKAEFILLDGYQDNDLFRIENYDIFHYFMSRGARMFYDSIQMPNADVAQR